MRTFEIDRSDSQSAMQIDHPESQGYAVSFSSGIRKLRNISHFLKVVDVVSPSSASRRKLSVDSVVVWGRKQNSLKGLNHARSLGLPVRYVEDGWIRSCSQNAHSRTVYSVLVDDVGVYYDSTTPSSLENYLNLPDELFDQQCGSPELAYAELCRRKIIDNNISKYNFCRSPDLAYMESESRSLVLVIDQTMDDASVAYGGMDKDSFEAMLDRAVAENPDSRIMVRTHPDVVAGRRKGYLQARAAELGIAISAEGDNPLPWLKRSSKVYVGTSQLGYEALLCGCEVHVAGLPFYAGWGLTHDYQKIARRIRTRTLNQLFYASHVHLARYCSPMTGENWSLMDCINHVCLQKKYFLLNARKHVCIGISPWKRRYIAQFLRSPDGQVRFSRINDAASDETPVCWSFRYADADAQSSVQGQGTRKMMRIEDGFMRSHGLGSDFVAPASLAFDEVGLYFDAGQQSALEQLLNDYSCSPEELLRARILRQEILEANITKYNVDRLTEGAVSTPECLAGRKRILVVGQVEGDQSILKGCLDVCSNSELLQAVRQAENDAYIVYRPHPDVESGNRQGSVDLETLDRCVDQVETQRNFLKSLDACDELHTMTSLSGFEAILRGKTVVTYGLPFYAGWGLTSDRHACSRRRRKRSVDELVYLCMALYPRYADLDTGEYISVEQLIRKFRISKSPQPTPRPRWVSKIRNVYRAMTYAA